MVVIALTHVRPVPERCLRVLADGDAVATDLCEGLVASGWAFRAAYAAVGTLVVTQRQVGKRLVDLTASDLQAAGLPESLLNRLDPQQAAERRAPGGPQSSG
jgi:argininosuccinate lyase